MVSAGAGDHRGHMLIPIISVTAIGLAVALRHHNRDVGAGPLAGAGLTGAWVGFLVFGLAGVIADVLLFGHVWPLLFGHLGAYGTARLAVSNRARAGSAAAITEGRARPSRHRSAPARW